MKKSKLFAVAALATMAVTLVGTTICLVSKNRKMKRKRLEEISNAGYEFAYDIHYPMNYKRR
jgi:hypothetical protein